MVTDEDPGRSETLASSVAKLGDKRVGCRAKRPSFHASCDIFSAAHGSQHVVPHTTIVLLAKKNSFEAAATLSRSATKLPIHALNGPSCQKERENVE